MEERFSKLKASAVPLAPFLALQLCDFVEPIVFQGLLDTGKKEAMDALCHEVGKKLKWLKLSKCSPKQQYALVMAVANLTAVFVELLRPLQSDDLRELVTVDENELHPEWREIFFTQQCEDGRLSRADLTAADSFITEARDAFKAAFRPAPVPAPKPPAKQAPKRAAERTGTGSAAAAAAATSPSARTRASARCAAALVAPSEVAKVLNSLRTLNCTYGAYVDLEPQTEYGLQFLNEAKAKAAGGPEAMKYPTPDGAEDIGGEAEDIGGEAEESGGEAEEDGGEAEEKGEQRPYTIIEAASDADIWAESYEIKFDYHNELSIVLSADGENVSAKPCPWDPKTTWLAFARRAFGKDFSFVRSLGGAMTRADLNAAYNELKEHNVLSSPWFHFSDQAWKATKQLGFAANYTQLLHQVRVIALRACYRRMEMPTSCLRCPGSRPFWWLHGAANCEAASPPGAAFAVREALQAAQAVHRCAIHGSPVEPAAGALRQVAY